MKQLFVLAAILALLGACSDANPLADHTASTTGAKITGAKITGAKITGAKTTGAKTTGAKTTGAKTGTAKTGTAKTGTAKTGTAKTAAKQTPAKEQQAKPKRVVIARLGDRPALTPDKLDRLAPASRRVDAKPHDPADDRADTGTEGDRMPASDQRFLDYLTGKKTRPPRSSPRRRVAKRSRRKPKPRGRVAKIGGYELDKIAPGAGPGRRVGTIDDAYSADRAFIEVLMTDTKPPRRRIRHRRTRHVRVRPTLRKSVTRTTAPAHRATHRAARRSRQATRVATRVVPRHTGRPLATLAGAAAADREVLKILGGD